jgi:hypothetical protein
MLLVATPEGLTKKGVQRSFMAMASAVLKPMPRMSRASR